MRPVHLAGLIALALIWGASFMFIEVLIEEVAPLAVGWLRLAGGTALIAGVVVATRRRVPRAGAYWRDVAVVSVLASAAPLVLIPWAQQEISSGLAAILNGAMPFWVAIFATLFLPAERLTASRVAGLALGFAGVAVIIGPDAFDLRSGSTQGQLGVVLATAGYAGGAVYTRRRLLGVDATTLAAAQNALAFAMLTPLVFVAGEAPDFAALDLETLLAAAGLAFLSQGVAIMLYYWLLTNVDATRVSVVTYLSPIAALFWGWLVLDEVPPAAVIPGFALIVAGIVVVNRRARAALQEPAPRSTR